MRKSLNKEYDSHEISYVQNVPGMGWSTEERDGIKEFSGDPKHIEKLIDDAAVLILGMAPVTAAAIEADKKLKLIAVARGGPVNVDVRAASKRRIPVVRSIGRNAESVANHTIGLMLAEARHIAKTYKAVKDGEWFKQRDKLLEAWGHKGFFEMNGKTLGLIGYGEVGRRVVVRAKAFGMRILIHDPYVPKEELEKVGCEAVDLKRLMMESDFVSIHARLTPETTHMIDSKLLALMKPSAILINTSRGAIIDEKALFKVLTERKIAGAALDVFEEEPVKMDNPLLKLENITFTSHTAGQSEMVIERGYQYVADAVARYIHGEKLTSNEVVDPEVLSSFQ